MLRWRCPIGRGSGGRDLSLQNPAQSDSDTLSPQFENQCFRFASNQYKALAC